jgi:hypothetical protein
MQLQNALGDLLPGDLFTEEDLQFMYESWTFRWNFFHRRNQGAAYLLAPTYLSDTGATSNKELMNSFLSVVEHSVPEEEQAKVLEQLTIFRRQKGLWGSSLAQKLHDVKDQLAIWEAFGTIMAPELKKLAFKILSLGCTTSAAERNFKDFAFVHDKKRNRLTNDRWVHWFKSSG